MNDLAPSVRSAGTIVSSSSRKLRILVVEDHADTLRGLELLLKRLGHQVTPANNMRTALKAANDAEFDLLLSDLGLPDGSGWELMGALEKSGRCPAQAVAMSGLCGFADKAKSRAAGFRAHWIKPFSPETLEAMLKTVASEASAALASSAA